MNVWIDITLHGQCAGYSGYSEIHSLLFSSSMSLLTGSSVLPCALEVAAGDGRVEGDLGISSSHSILVCHFSGLSRG